MTPVNIWLKRWGGKMKLCEIKFPKVKEIAYYPENYSYSKEWYSYQYGFMKDYFIKTLSGWSVMHFFDEDVKEKIAVYSIINFSEILIKDINRFSSIIYLADKNAHKYEKGYQGYHVLNQKQLVQLYREGVIKKIIVCNFFHANEIMQELMDLGIDLNDLVTITEILVETR